MLQANVDRLAPVLPGIVVQPTARREPVLRIDTDDWLPRTKFAGWKQQVGDVIDALPDGDPTLGFDAEMAAWDLGGLLLIETRLPRLAYRRSLRQCRADGLDHWVLAALRSADSPSLSVMCLDQPFAGHFPAGEAAYLCVPRDFLRPAATAMDSLNGAVLASGLGRLLAEFLVNLATRLPELDPADYPGVRSSVRALIEGCIVPAGPGPAGDMRPVQASILERARRIVQQRLGSPSLGVDELCHELAVSRSQLYRLFEPLGGVMHYIRRRRLLDAHVALADAEDRRSIVEIAAERGFIDPAEFSRAFKREFGYRPSDARAHTELPLPRQRDSSARTLTALLCNLR